MRKKKIMIVFGTRPEAIKIAPLVNLLKAEPDQFEVKICITSQHREMLDQVLEIFNIEPDIDLNLMSHDQSLFNLTSLILNKMQIIFKDYKPDVLLVHGDTTTTLAASISAFYASIPVGHIEAGLRTNNIRSPFPEEFNRQVTSKITKWHFAPTELNQQNLILEGFEESMITVTGNTVIDALYLILENLEKNKIRKKSLIQFLNSKLSFDWQSTKYIIITAHRRENFGNGISQICSAIRELAIKYPKLHFVFPVHPNPNVSNVVNKLLDNFKNIHLTKPLEYEPFVYLLKNSHIVLTDSGGIQEEAPSLGKPVLVMRDVTERPEALAQGTTEMVGGSCQNIVKATSHLIDDDSLYQKKSIIKNPYGDGLASKRIVDILRAIEIT